MHEENRRVLQVYLTALLAGGSAAIAVNEIPQLESVRKGNIINLLLAALLYFASKRAIPQVADTLFIVSMMALIPQVTINSAYDRHRIARQLRQYGRNGTA